MPTFEVWDIVKVPFPYTSRPVRQSRPALVVASRQFSAAGELLWVLMITSADNRPWPGDTAISDLREAGLPAPSVVRSAKIATIEAADAQLLGRLPAADRTLVTNHIKSHLAGVID
jgi:mRNA interferase MazF